MTIFFGTRVCPQDHPQHARKFLGAESFKLLRLVWQTQPRSGEELCRAPWAGLFPDFSLIDGAGKGGIRTKNPAHECPNTGVGAVLRGELTPPRDPFVPFIQLKSLSAQTDSFPCASREDMAIFHPITGEAYGQRVDKRKAPGATGPYYHPLRVYLIDGERQVRNIYSFGLLDPRLVMTDVRTLMLEDAAGQAVRAEAQVSSVAR